MKMPDRLSTLMQVSFTMRDCDLVECVKKWEPLLSVVGRKRGKSAVGMLNQALLTFLQRTDQMGLSQEEAKELPSQNDEMGSSLIERSLDDTTLAHCFSFLDIKDVSTSIERTSHRFLQVSRNRKRPFHVKCLDMLNYKDDPNLHPSFKHLVCPWFRVATLDVCSSNLKRFRVDHLHCDPTSNSPGFSSVLRIIGSTLHSCSLTIESTRSDAEWRLSCSFPNVKSVKISGLHPDYFPMFHSLFHHCRKFHFIDCEFNSTEDLIKFTELRELKIEDCRFQLSTVVNDSDPPSLCNLTDLSLDATLLPHFSAILTQCIRTLTVNFNDGQTNLSSHYTGHLSQIEQLCLHSMRNRQQSRMVRSHLGLPPRIPELHLSIDRWSVVLDWVSCVDVLSVVFHKSSDSPSLNNEIAQCIIDECSVQRCSLKLDHPNNEDVDFIAKLVGCAQHTQFMVQIEYFADSGAAHGIVTLASLDQSNCTVQTRILAQD